MKPKGPRYTPVSIYEEKLLLKRLEACPGAVAMTPEARRLKRKLIVRQAKRDRGLPLFDLDEVVNAALLLVDGIYGAKDGGASRLAAGQATYRTTCQDFRILDRYQVMLLYCDICHCEQSGEKKASKTSLLLFQNCSSFSAPSCI